MSACRLHALAASHKTHPDIDGCVTIRYDADRDADGDPVVYGFFKDSDLVKVPPELLSYLGVGATEDPNRTVFFVANDHELRLMFNTDDFGSFRSEILEVFSDRGSGQTIHLQEAVGDMRHFTSPDGEIETPEMPAYLIDGMEYMETDSAMAYLAELRRDFMVGRSRHEDLGPDLS